MKKVSPFLLWGQIVCGIGTVITSILRAYAYIDVFWPPILLASGALICTAVRYYVDRQAGRLSAQVHTERVETIAKEREEGDGRLQGQITPILTAFEPRRVTHAQRDKVLSILLKKENTSPKPRVQVIVAPGTETEDFAKKIADLLIDAGYRKKDDALIRADAKLVSDGRRLPHFFAVFSSGDNGIPPATIGGGFGSIKIFHATPFSITKGDTTHPLAFRHTDNVNDILYGLIEVFTHAEFRVGTLSGKGILRKGQIGFYIPSQI